MTPAAPAVRPRIEGDREDEILEATLEVLLEVGYDRLTFDAVARAARAGKATLYRRWADKPSLVVDAMVRAKQAPVVEHHDTGTLRGDLVGTFCGHHGLGRNDATVLMGSVITALASDAAFAARFREAFIAPKVAVSQEIYRRAVVRGEIADDTDLDVIAPALAGILLHRSFVLGLPPDGETVLRVIDHVILPAVGIRAPAPTDGPASTTTQQKA